MKNKYLLLQLNFEVGAVVQLNRFELGLKLVQPLEPGIRTRFPFYNFI